MDGRSLFTPFNRALDQEWTLCYVLDMVEPRYTPDELARLGDAIYERDIRPRMRAEDTGRIVAVDVETGTYAVGSDLLATARQVFESIPRAQLWFKRVGFAYVHSFGGRDPLRSAGEP